MNDLVMVVLLPIDAHRPRIEEEMSVDEEMVVCGESRDGPRISVDLRVNDSHKIRQ